ncbi:TIGR02679 family protein [Micromonospora sp. NBC_01813]|uniref:TIGR02679 family protein n=1 Tax=Micromonospora sp. NBC_01813 TaxID=2975988 RepID=UPI002DD8EE23|nr:TIGR02679 family protein [Micromonospora sp. NBC_01813]WSA06668.1 TIGR02679 family protein [Micromonospora sp. NBC_01813]
MTRPDAGVTGPDAGVTGPDLDRLRRQLGGADTERVVQRLRQRIAQGRPLTGTLSLSQPTPAERQAVQRLLGRPPGRGTSLTVNLDDLDQVVRRSGLHPDGLAAAVETLAGPVPVTAEVRAAADAAWRTVLAPLDRLGRRAPDLADWCGDRATLTLLRRLSGTPAVAGRLVDHLVAVLAALPADGVPLARLAAHTTGDAHALDADRPLATLVLSAVRAVWWPGDDEPTSPAQRRRALWDSAGVLVDELSSTVLTLNVTASPGSQLYALTAPAATAGEPLVLTLRQLGRERPTFPAGTVHVCENPTVLAAAADLLGPACPPLVCVNGQPSTAALRLLAGLTTSGARLRYHGDFDWGGVRIANLLRSRVPWQPWRYDAAAYRAAVAGAAVAGAASGTLTGQPVDASWDTGLSAAMSQHGTRIEEELVLDTLLADLSEVR